MPEITSENLVPDSLAPLKLPSDRELVMRVMPMPGGMNSASFAPFPRLSSQSSRSARLKPTARVFPQPTGLWRSAAFTSPFGPSGCGAGWMGASGRGGATGAEGAGAGTGRGATGSSAGRLRCGRR